MGQTVRFHASSEQAAWVITAALARRGYHLVRSFDLQTARAHHAEGCTCPHHGTVDCTCQYTVTLAYPPGPVKAGFLAAPHVLAAHTHGNTTLVIVQSDQEADGDDRRAVMAAVLEAAGQVLADPYADEPEPCLAAFRSA